MLASNNRTEGHVIQMTNASVNYTLTDRSSHAYRWTIYLLSNLHVEELLLTLLFYFLNKFPRCDVALLLNKIRKWKLILKKSNYFQSSLSTKRNKIESHSRARSEIPAITQKYLWSIKGKKRRTRTSNSHMHKTTRIPFFSAAASHAISPIVCKSSTQTKNEKAPTQTFAPSHLCPPIASVWAAGKLATVATQSNREPHRKQPRYYSWIDLISLHIDRHRLVEHAFISRLQLVNYSASILLST